MLSFQTVNRGLVLMAGTMHFPRQHDEEAVEWWLRLMGEIEATDDEFRDATARLSLKMAEMPTPKHFRDEIEAIREERRAALARSIVAIPLDHSPSSLPQEGAE